MADTTGELRNLTDATYTDLRQGNSLTIRTERLMRMAVLVLALAVAVVELFPRA